METQLNQHDQSKARRLFERQQREVFCRTDHLFAGLMMFQWVGGVVAALWVSPKTWIGTQSQTHLHVWAAVVVGGAITSLPVLLAMTRPGLALTRHVIAIGQML